MKSSVVSVDAGCYLRITAPQLDLRDGTTYSWEGLEPGETAERIMTRIRAEIQQRRVFLGENAVTILVRFMTRKGTEQNREAVQRIVDEEVVATCRRLSIPVPTG